MRRPGASAVIYLCLVFLSGILVGAFGWRMYSVRAEGGKNPCSPEAMRRQYIEDMRTRLNLSGDQFGKVQSILDETHERFRALREKYRPEVRTIQEEQVERIRAVLDPGQRAEYEKMRQEREHHGPPGQGHQGPPAGRRAPGGPPDSR